MRGLFMDNLTSLVGDVFRGVTDSTSRMKESVLFHKEEEEKKYKQMEERKNKEVAKLKEELKERDKQVEERNKQIKAKEEELKTREEKIDKLKKKLDDKDGIIGELRKHNAGLKVAFDLNAGVIMQMQDWDAKIEEANLKAANFKSSRQEVEETTGPAVKKVCLAVKQLGSKKQEVVANGLQVLEASAKIIGPAVDQSKNQKRRAQRERAMKGNKYCGICKDFFRLDL
jgi:DNA repair exonuclease SbcCD ATPase subunit